MVNYINEIINGESLNILRQLPDHCVDAVITDPPYSSGGLTHSNRSRDPVAKYQQTTNKIVNRPTFAGAITVMHGHGCTGARCGSRNVIES